MKFYCKLSFKYNYYPKKLTDTVLFSPFQRTATDNDKIYNIVKNFPAIAGQVSPKVLKELCVVAVLESWKDTGITGLWRHL